MNKTPDIKSYPYQSVENSQSREDYRLLSAKTYDKLTTIVDHQIKKTGFSALFNKNPDITGFVCYDSGTPSYQATITVDQNGKPWGPETTLTFDGNGLLEFQQKVVQTDSSGFNTSINAKKTVDGGEITVAYGNIAEVFNDYAKGRAWGKKDKAAKVEDNGKGFSMQLKYDHDDELTEAKFVGNGQEVTVPMLKGKGWDKNTVGPTGERELGSTSSVSEKPEDYIDLENGLRMLPYFKAVASPSESGAHCEVSFKLIYKDCPENETYNYNVLYGATTVPNSFPDTYKYKIENYGPTINVPRALEPTERYKKPVEKETQRQSVMMIGRAK